MRDIVRYRARYAAALLACLAVVAAAGCTGATAAPTCPPGSGPAECTRILFLGNSYTYVNDLPSTFAQLAGSAGRPVQVAMVANGGETLAQHAASAESRARINSQGWTYVVLQEQSDTPSTSAGSDAFMYPAARSLARNIEDAGSVPMFFMTWAHKDGEPTAGLGYEGMQRQVDAAYADIAGELHVPVAPVGFTWFIVRADHPEMALWSDDGSHPSTAGTYLAACVFYASIFKASPVGLGYHGGVPADQAAILQDEAGRHVLDLRDQWGLR
jgi:hypothetical protein